MHFSLISAVFAPAPVGLEAVDVTSSSLVLQWNNSFDSVPPDGFILQYNVTKLSGLPAEVSEFNRTLSISDVMAMPPSGLDYVYSVENLVAYSNYEFLLFAVYGDNISLAAVVAEQTREGSEFIMTHVTYVKHASNSCLHVCM